MEQLLPAIPRLHRGAAEWAACLIFIFISTKKIKGVRLVGWLMIALLVQCAVQICGLLLPRNLGLWFGVMGVAVLFMYLLIYRSCRMSAGDAAYCGIRAFLLSEFAASMEWQIYCFFILPLSSRWGELRKLGIMLGTYATVFYLAYRIERRLVPRDGKLRISRQELISSVIIGVITFVVSNSGFMRFRTPFSAEKDFEIFIVRTAVVFGGLAVLYAHHILNAELQRKREVDAIKNVLQRQYDQYEISKENIELLNMRYHDFKNQIAMIRAEDNMEKREEYLTELEGHLKIYEFTHKTGNKVLDMVLTSKSQHCVNQEIELTCVANGELLDFMDPLDICTVFGNALDNAIECEEQIEDKEKRLIHVAVFAKGSLLIILVENYFEGELKDVSEGIPATTKQDRRYHGYGLKSIRYSVERYDGVVKMIKDKNWVKLKIMIPM